MTSSSSTGCYANGLSLTGSCARVITISPLICENITRTVNLKNTLYFCFQFFVCFGYLCCTPRSRGVSICALKVFHTYDININFMVFSLMAIFTFIFKGKYTILPRSCRTTVWNSLVNKSTQSNCIIARGTRAESLISFLMLYYHFFLNLFFMYYILTNIIQNI